MRSLNTLGVFSFMYVQVQMVSRMTERKAWKSNKADISAACQGLLSSDVTGQSAARANALAVCFQLCVLGAADVSSAKRNAIQCDHLNTLSWWPSRPEPSCWPS